MRRVEAVVAAVSRAAATLAALACLGAFALVCYEVAMRYFLNRPQPWTDEAVGWLLVAIVMLAAPEAQRRGEHIGVEALVERLAGRWRQGLVIFGTATVVAVGVLLAVEGLAMVRFTRQIGLSSNRLPQIELWLVQALVPLGAVLLGVVAAVQIACHALGLAPRGPAEDPGGGPKDMRE